MSVAASGLAAACVKAPRYGTRGGNALERELRRCTALSTATGNLGPGVAQADRAVEHQPIGRRIRIEAEIALPLELHRLVGIFAGQSRLNARIGDDFERLGIEIS